MSQLEQGATSPFLPLVDLKQIDCDKRAHKWRCAVRDSFPSLSIRLPVGTPPTGSISRVSMGSGDFFEIDSAPADVTHTVKDTRAKNSHISLMVQSKGAILVRQAGRSAMLGKGDACVIDEARSFRLIGEGRSKIHFLRIPRAAALSRYPPLEKLFVTTFSCDDPGTQMLVETMLRFSEVAGTLNGSQRNAMTNAIIQMLGMAEPFINQEAAPDWRVRRALDFIELNLSVAGLTAEAVAVDQRISRRRLDQLMLQSFGHSIASHLWSRRLEQAAADLRDPARASQSIAQIAFANGFEDAAHFTRAFKRRFSQTPRQWRAT